MFIDYSRIVTARVENNKSEIEVCWLYHKRIVKTVVTTLRGRINQSCLDTLGWCFHDSSVCEIACSKVWNCGYSIWSIHFRAGCQSGDTKRRSRCHGVPGDCVGERAARRMKNVKKKTPAVDLQPVSPRYRMTLGANKYHPFRLQSAPTNCKETCTPSRQPRQSNTVRSSPSSPIQPHPIKARSDHQ